jgi:hypothetical protein
VALPGSVYSMKAKLVAMITGFDEPQGMAADPDGNLYHRHAQ